MLIVPCSMLTAALLVLLRCRDDVTDVVVAARRRVQAGRAVADPADVTADAGELADALVQILQVLVE